MAQAFSFLIMHTLMAGRYPLLHSILQVVGNFLFEILGWMWWMWWIFFSIVLMFYHLSLLVVHGIAWWTIFLPLMIMPSQLYFPLRLLPCSPYSHKRWIKHFIQSPGPYVEAYNSRLVLISSYQIHGWWLIFLFMFLGRFRWF